MTDPNTATPSASTEPTTQPNPAPTSWFASVLAVLANPSVRRLLVFLVGFFTVALNKRLELELDANALVTDAVLVLGYIAQSAHKEASMARSEALALGAVKS